MDSITREQAQALANLIHELRPDWGTPGVLKSLSDARTKGDAYKLAHAALNAAETPTNRTPAIIPMDGPHWTLANASQSTTTRKVNAGLELVAKYEQEERRERAEHTADHKAGTHAGRPTSNCPLCAPAYAEVTA